MVLPTQQSLNAICAYFTMFPLEFPLKYLKYNAKQKECVLDPFCGRGTTPFAARLLGLYTIGIDSNPVAYALTQAKMVNPSIEEIMNAANDLLEEISSPQDIPATEFWRYAYNPEVLRTLCRLREGLLKNCETEAKIALRAIILGALHGPVTKTPSYFSNQAPRTYGPKPNYAVKYWKKHNLLPQNVDVLKIIRTRAERYYGLKMCKTPNCIIYGDSSKIATFEAIKNKISSDPAFSVSRIVTSPPYYGMRTYLPDQWIRNWFLGGPPEVDYSIKGQLPHTLV